MVKKIKIILIIIFIFVEFSFSQSKDFSENVDVKIRILKYNNIELIYSDDILFFYSLIYYKYGEEYIKDLYVKKLVIELLESSNITKYLDKIELRNTRNKAFIFSIIHIYYCSLRKYEIFPSLKILFKKFIENKENEKIYEKIEEKFYNYSFNILIKLYSQSLTYFSIFINKEFRISLNYIGYEQNVSFYEVYDDISIVSILTNEYRTLITFIHELTHQYYHKLEENRFELINNNIKDDYLLKNIVLYCSYIFPDNYSFQDIFTVLENKEEISGTSFNLNFSEFIACFISFYFFPLEKKLIGLDDIIEFNVYLLEKIYIKLYKYIRYSQDKMIFHNIKNDYFNEKSFLILFKIYLLFKLNKFDLIKEILI